MLWAAAGLSRLRSETRELMDDPDNEVWVSAASVWEAAIKVASGKLRLRDDLSEIVERTGFTPLPIQYEHALAAGALPRLHGDPFDRMLVAQAQLEDLILVTTDRALAVYDVALLPA